MRSTAMGQSLESITNQTVHDLHDALSMAHDLTARLDAFSNHKRNPLPLQHTTAALTHQLRKVRDKAEFRRVDRDQTRSQKLLQYLVNALNRIIAAANPLLDGWLAEFFVMTLQVFKRQLDYGERIIDLMRGPCCQSTDRRKFFITSFQAIEAQGAAKSSMRLPEYQQRRGDHPNEGSGRKHKRGKRFNVRRQGLMAAGKNCELNAYKKDKGAQCTGHDPTPFLRAKKKKR